MKLTAKRMDAAIVRIWTPEGTSNTRRDRAIFLAGMKAAEKIARAARMDVYSMPYIAIGKAVKRLRKEAGL